MQVQEVNDLEVSALQRVLKSDLIKKEVPDGIKLTFGKHYRVIQDLSLLLYHFKKLEYIFLFISTLVEDFISTIN